MKAFISGPMTGHKNYNREAFARAAKELRKQGHDVFNPGELPDGHDYDWYMRICERQIESCAVVVMLKGWQDSAGAMREYDKAIECGVQTMDWWGV